MPPIQPLTRGDWPVVEASIRTCSVRRNVATFRPRKGRRGLRTASVCVHDQLHVVYAPPGREWFRILRNAVLLKQSGPATKIRRCPPCSVRRGENHEQNIRRKNGKGLGITQVHFQRRSRKGQSLGQHCQTTPKCQVPGRSAYRRSGGTGSVPFGRPASCTVCPSERPLGSAAYRNALS